MTPTKQCVNNLYYQFGFYSTGTPMFQRDLLHNNNDGVIPKEEQLVLYGMKHHLEYGFAEASDSMEKDTFIGKGRDTFADLNPGLGPAMKGYSVVNDDTDSNGNAYPQRTASVIAGENGQDANAAALGPLKEAAEKYAYVAKGYDILTVTPMPDLMTGEKVTITYTGPSAGCSVTEVDRGTHESSECSGRGNCDRASGTCLCDAGYTLEACSEQTVLV